MIRFLSSSESVVIQFASFDASKAISSMGRDKERLNEVMVSVKDSTLLVGNREANLKHVGLVTARLSAREVTRLSVLGCATTVFV
mmetsp:Transcript_27249/g.73630  ORF Transcript_27249/g.73630 Transcript_27249/m.73630 type:complete len:85 (-) Transcript_27249:195-449(-)